MSNTPNYIEPAESAECLKEFMQSTNKRVLFYTGISGIGKSTFLRNYSEAESLVVYNDLSVHSSLLGIIQNIYSKFFPEKDIRQEITDIHKDLFSGYLEHVNVGNIEISKSDLKDVKIRQKVSFSNISLDESIVIEFAKKLVVTHLASERYCLIFDQFEEFSDNRAVISLIRFFLKYCPYLKFLLVSKQAIDNKFLDEDKVQEYSTGGFNLVESTTYLNNRGIKDEDIIEQANNFCKGHPLFLKMFADAIRRGMDIDKSIASASHNARFKHLFTKISTSYEPKIRQAFHSLPLCRFFSMKQVRHTLGVNSFEAEEICRVLSDHLYINYFENSGLYRFNELFTNLQRMEISKKDQRDFDAKVVDYYMQEEEDGTEVELQRMIEPFYHLQHFSDKRACDYFEEKYKPSLDKQNKYLSSILITQIRFDLVSDESVRHWYLLRFGGYYREFGMYEKAKPYFIDLLNNENLEIKTRAYALNNLGICHLFTGNLEESRLCFNKSIKLCDELGLMKIKAHNLNNIGISWNRENDLSRAETFYNQSFKIYREESVEGLFLGKVFYNYSGLLKTRKKYSQSIKIALIGENKYLKDGDLIGGINCRIIIIDCLLHQGKYEFAFELMNKSKKYFSRVLHEYDLDKNQPRLYYLSAIVSLYNSSEGTFISDFVQALEYSLQYDFEEHKWLINRIIQICIFANKTELLDSIKESIQSSQSLQEVASAIKEILDDMVNTQWVVKEDSNIYHVPGCINYMNNHFLDRCRLILRSSIIMEESINTCVCFHQQ